MRLLFHYPLSPSSRLIRIFMKEKDLDFELINENFWERRPEFLKISPSSQVPALIDDEIKILDVMAMCEFLEETNPSKSMISGNAAQKAEIRSVANWFNNKFYYEVTRYILEEKVLKFLRNSGEPNSEAIRAGKTNLEYHMKYIEFLIKSRSWLGGDVFSLADISAAAQLSVIDYLGDVPWENNEAVKEWYSIVKSRPSFRPILSDRIVSFKPPKHYSDLDF